MNRIIVDINQLQTRVALINDGNLQEVYVESETKMRLAGNIYKGRVANILPGMEAAFVDLGLEKNAFLYAGDILADKSDFVFPGGGEVVISPCIKDIVKQGQEIIVQIVKEPCGTKGARVTSHITLPGRTLVLMPTVNYVGVSRRIEDEEERSRLRSIMERIKPENMGVIVRTAAQGKSEEEFAVDFASLLKKWEKVQETGRTSGAPRILHSEQTLAMRTIRDLYTADIGEVVVNDRQCHEKLVEMAAVISPELRDSVKYIDRFNLFEEYDVEGKLEKLLVRKVWLKNGGYLVIDQTEALTVIDVNTGKYVGEDNLQHTLIATNREAAAEIARQLRLRDISGIIIIDFIDMEEQSSRDMIIEILTEELKKDRTKTNVLGITQLGLVEMTRKKVRRNISETLQVSCQYCHGEGRVLSPETVAHKIARQLATEFEHQSCDTFLIEAHPSVAAFLESCSKSEHRLLPRREGACVYIRQVIYMHVKEYRIIPVTDMRMVEGFQDTQVLC